MLAFGSDRRRLRLRGGLEVEQAPLAELGDLAPAPSLVLHLAFLTQEKAALMPREDYVAINRGISGTVFAALDKIGAEGVFVASSGAVEMVGRDGADPNKALYGALKLADEARFGDWAAANGGRCVSARIFGLSGPYINKLDSYALACFIRDVLRQRPIAIRSARPVYRSYVSVTELTSLVLGLLTDEGAGGWLFDTGAKRGYEMGEIAAGLARALDHRHGVTRPPLGEAGEDRYVGDGAAYMALRAAMDVERVDFARQTRETADYMAEALGLARPP